MINQVPVLSAIQPGMTQSSGIHFDLQDSPYIHDNEYTGYKIKIYDGLSNQKIIETIIDKSNKKYIPPEENTVFINDNFYKYQIAYFNSDTNTTGPYSNIGVGKYLTEYKPVWVQEILNGKIQLTFSTDSKEKIIAIRYFLFNDNKKCYESQWQNFPQDNKKYVFPYITFSPDIIESELLQIQVEYKTVNKFDGKYVEAIDQKIIKNIPITPSINYDFNNNINDWDLEKSYIEKETICKYRALLFNVKNNDGCVIWDELPNDVTEDHSIIMGETYVYISGNGSINIAYRHFEHSYLLDETHNYCIKFNPEISSFKTILQETKTETLGSQYPFIYRNKKIHYKEFSISGLISRLMDIDSTNKDFNATRFDTTIQNNDYSIALEANNIYQERKYREELVNWLTNGEPKIFKSPTEGNFIVRLIDISLTPEKTLGRMLYKFSATAVEIADYTMAEILKNKLFYSNN